MEVVGGVANIIAVVDLTARIGGYLVRYYKGARNAPKEIEQMQLSLHALNSVADELRRLIDDPRSSRLDATRSAALIAQGKACQTKLEGLDNQLRPENQGIFLRYPSLTFSWTSKRHFQLEMKKRRILSRGVRSMKWPFKREEAESVIQSLRDWQVTFTGALAVDNFGLLSKALEKLAFQGMTEVRAAAWNSHENRHEPFCNPKTRIAVLKEIMSWAKKEPSSSSVFWLRGMAGTGKSTISRSVCQSLEKEGLLGASFFFKRDEADRRSAANFITTITAQLARSHTDLRPHILTSLDNGPASWLIKDQFDAFIHQPLASADKSPPLRSVLVFDALDECEDYRDISEIIRLLLATAHLKSVDLRIFLTSRPELPNMGVFRGLHLPEPSIRSMELHDVPVSEIQDDIGVYLNEEFSNMRKRLQPTLPQPWPEAGQLRALVERASPLFIYAATLVRFLADEEQNPCFTLQEQLQYILDNPFTGSTKLQGTYYPILSRIQEGIQDSQRKEAFLEDFKLIVGSIVVLFEPLALLSLARILGKTEDIVRRRLDRLHSVLYVPSESTLGTPIRTFHASLREFLINRDSSKTFWVNEPATHLLLAEKCLNLLSTCGHLRTDIHDVKRPGTKMTDVDPEVIMRNLPPHVQYACRYWVDHMVQSVDGRGYLSKGHVILVHDFLRKHFLHWVEALCWMKRSGDVVYQILRLEPVIQADEPRGLAAFLNDASRFIQKFEQVARRAPLQLYSSALVFSPTQSIVRQTFDTEIPKWVLHPPETDQSWSSVRSIVEAQNDVISIAWSPDNKHLASGSRGGSIQLWDITSGTLAGTLGDAETQRGAFNLAFSRNGEHLAAVYDDNAIHHMTQKDRTWLIVWDLVSKTPTWSPITPEGTSFTDQALSISDSGTIAASGRNSGWDNNVYLWHPSAEPRPFTVKKRSFRHTEFAPDGETVLIVTQPFSGPGEMYEVLKRRLAQLVNMTADGFRTRDFPGVRAATFISGDKLATILGDEYAICIYNLDGAPIRKVALVGEIPMRTDFAFSPTGDVIAGSNIGTHIYNWGEDPANTRVSRVRVFSVENGQGGKYHEFKQIIEHFKLSPDSSRFAVAFRSKEIHIVDSNSPQPSEQTSQINNQLSIRSVGLSHDRQDLMLASGDLGGGIVVCKSWGDKLRKCYIHLKASDIVWCLAFSWCGTYLAAANNDRKVDIWDISSSRSVASFLTRTQDNAKELRFSRDGKFLVIGGFSFLKLWDTSSRTLFTIWAHREDFMVRSQEDGMKGCELSTDDSLIYTGHQNGEVRVWDIATRSRINAFRTEPPDPLSYLAIFRSEQGDRLATTHRPGSGAIRVWEVDSGECLTIPANHIKDREENKWWEELHFSLDGNYVAVGFAWLPIKDVNSADAGPFELVVKKDGWVARRDRDGGDILWLPPEYRPNDRKWISDNGFLLIGSDSGNVVSMELARPD